MVSRTTADDLCIDLLKNIIARLPASSFASAHCVSRSWNYVCDRILCRPKLSSACSSNSSLQVAVEEVANKILSEPIRPQFAIVSISPAFSLQETLKLITAKLSSKVPIIIDRSFKAIGADVIPDEFKETQRGCSPDSQIVNSGIMLTVGFVPGVKVKLMSPSRKLEDPKFFMLDEFITDIKQFSKSVSGHQAPAVIMLFSIYSGHMDAVMRKMDYDMPMETIIVGNCGYDIEHNIPEEHVVTKERFAVVALVFVTNKKKPPGIGETRFNSVVSSGFSPVGPTTYTVDSVREDHDEYTTSLTGHTEGPFVATKKGNCPPTMNIGVTKRRKCSIGQEEAKCVTSLAYHLVLEKEEDHESLLVDDVGIETGDTYRYYYPISNIVRSYVDNAFDLLRPFKESSINGSDKGVVCGGLVFTSNMRKVTCLGPAFTESSADLEDSPGVALGGARCLKEIGCGYLTAQEPQQMSLRPCLHKYNTVYLIISYTP